MDKTLQSNLLTEGHRNPVPLARGMGWGLPWRTGRHDGDGHPPHGSIICTSDYPL